MIYTEWQLFKRTDEAQRVLSEVPLIAFLFYRLAWWAESLRRAVAVRLSVIVPVIALLTIVGGSTCAS
jgi:hypothetical protein